jgi:hypothetical protein
LTSPGPIGGTTPGAASFTTLAVSGGATLSGATLGTTAGSSSLALSVPVNTGNISRLEVAFLRYNNGTDWQTATTRLQQVVDFTTMSYIDFNPPGEPWGLAIGVGNGTTSPQEVLRFRYGGADLIRPYTGFSYDSYASQHVAFTKKAGGYSYYFRKSDTGASDGPNLTTLFEIHDNGDTVTSGVAYSPLSRVTNNYAQTQLLTDQGRGWRLITESHGNTFGDLVLQGTVDNYITSFVTPLTLKTNGDVEMSGSVITGQRLEINKFATADSVGYIDICAQPGSDADARIWRDGGANGGFSIQNGGNGNLGFYTGGAAGQPWTANKGFHINGSNGTLYLTNGLALENSQALHFRDTGGSYPYMLTQADNNWVFYGSGSTGAPRPIMSCIMRSDTEPFRFYVPLEVEGNPVGGPGSIVKTVSAESTTFATMTAVIPADDTIPQNTEGTLVLSAPISTTADFRIIRVRVSLYGSVNVAGATITAAVCFNQSHAQHAFATAVPAANYAVSMHSECQLSVGVAGTYTVFVRIGPSSGTLSLNGLNGTRRYGGVARCSLVLEELGA